MLVCLIFSLTSDVCCGNLVPNFSKFVLYCFSLFEAADRLHLTPNFLRFVASRFLFCASSLAAHLSLQYGVYPVRIPVKCVSLPHVGQMPSPDLRMYVS